MGKVQIVGILNVTPDSYFDGGKHADVAAAVERAGRMLAEGADIIEIGGESTGPGSKDVSLEEELSRVIPVIDGLRARFPSARLSVDTVKSIVAAEALRAGASLVNDVSAGRFDQKMYSVISPSAGALVLMYSKDSSPRTTIENRQYDDFVGTVKAFLRERMLAAELAGIDRARIVLDPGLGHFVSSDPR